MAVITAAKAMAATVVDLLADGARSGNKVVAEHRPEMTRSEYLKFMRSLASEQTFERETMSTREELKKRACAAIDRHRDELIGVSRQILNNPEPGFSEYKTSQLVADKFDEMGIGYRRGLAMTGVKGPRFRRWGFRAQGCCHRRVGLAYS